MTFDPTLHLSVEKQAARIDPLGAFRFRNPVQRELVKAVVHRKLEVYLHASNMAGKTTAGAALSVALARGCRQLHDVQLPRLDMPAAGCLVGGSYKQMVASSIAAYRSMIGSWPHHEAMVQGSLDYVGVFYVKPEGWRSDDYKTWSRIYVFTHDGEVPEGLRLDFVHADEIPPERIWRAARFRAKAGKPFFAYITGTPIDERSWRWLMAEDEFLPCRDEPENGRLRLQSSIYDNAALSKEDIERAERAAASDPHGQARLWGEHIDVAGTPAFAPDTLARWRGRCIPGKTETVIVRTKRPGTGESPEIPLQISSWGERDDSDSYYITADLASGIRAGTHDPLCLHVWARRARTLATTYIGYVHPYGLGFLAGLLASRYVTPVAEPLVDPERHPGFIESFVEGLYDAGYYALFRAGTEIGYKQGEATRNAIVAAWLKAMINDDAVIYDADVISCLANCVIDERGRVVARTGYHDEHLICGGRFLAISDEKPAPSPRVERGPATSTGRFAAMLERSFGRPVLPASTGRPGSPGDAWDPPSP